MAKKINKNFFTLEEEGITLERKLYSKPDGSIHHDTEPALIDYYQNGKIKRKVFFQDNCIHRDNDPALFEYDELGKPTKEAYYKSNKLHRDGEWAVRSREKCENSEEIAVTYSWHMTGFLHRIDGPAWMQYLEESQNNKNQFAYVICDEVIENDNFIKLIKWYDDNLFNPDIPLSEDRLMLRKIHLGF